LQEVFCVLENSCKSSIGAIKAGIHIKQLQIQLRHHSLDQVDEYLRQLGVSDLGDLRDNFPSI